MLITDDEKFAEKVGEETWGAMKEGEKKMKDKHDEEERLKREEEEKKRKEGEEWKSHAAFVFKNIFQLRKTSLWHIKMP